MVKKRHHKLNRLVFLFLITIISISTLPGQSKKALTFQDIMKFKAIKNPVIAVDGNWLAYSAQADRGDGEVKVHSIKNKKVFTIERGSKPVISGDSRWIAATVLPKAGELDKSKNSKDKPQNGLALLNTETGEIIIVEKVEKSTFSENSKWLAYKLFKKDESNNKKDDESKQGKAGSAKAKKNLGTTIVLLNLGTKEELKIPFGHSFAFDSTSQYLAFAVSDTSGKENGLYYLELQKDDLSRKTIASQVNGYYTNLTWNNKHGMLACLSSTLDKKGNPDSTSMWIWDPSKMQTTEMVAVDGAPAGWCVPEKNQLEWTRDGQRLFFGLKPLSENEKDDDNAEEKSNKDKEEEYDPYDVDGLLGKKEVDVWHWNDPRIIPNQKKMWKNVKDRTYKAVYHLDTGKYVALADKEMPDVRTPQNSQFALGVSDVPYLKLLTWDGGYNNYYLVDLQDGSRKEIVSKLRGRASLSPRGNFVLYYNDKHWHLYDRKTGSTRNLTENLEVPFYNEDHDYPSPVPGYRSAGWLEDDSAVLIYDKYDIWQFATDSGTPINLTRGWGRQNNYTFRNQTLEPEQRNFKKDQQLLLSAHHNYQKHTAFYSCKIGRAGVKKLIEEKKLFRFLAKAKNKNLLMYTRETYTEFPDIWVSDIGFRSPKKISNLNSQISEFAWGSSELVEWKSIDGIPLQGVLIKPGNYEPGKQYPVLVYYYRFFSQRVHEFNQTVLNHRPCFPFYASNGYAVFLPDIRFEIGRPGYSATKCLVPGVQKIIDMGIADPDAIGLHGHSWSGYQTALVVTQTDIFACAIAGAPVSNMTSAYSGIRWGTGLARQFQYEQSQSRIGGSLWEARDLYIENSPVFFADRINTPLLIMFGDEDGAVPWYQGIELYLAMRRLQKDCVFLQYRGEPHHLQKYPNKLDYSIKMKEYLDFYLKGDQSAKWIVEGVPYEGK